VDIRLLGSVFRLRQLAQQFGHFWAYAVSPETIAELFGNSASFAEFQDKLREHCTALNISPVGGRYLEDASFEGGWLTAHFGGSNQLRVALNPNQTLLRVEYTNGDRYTCAIYHDSGGELVWESFPKTARDAVRVLRTLAILAECDPKLFLTTYLPKELDNEEAQLYQRTLSWAHLWVNPSDLKDILSAR
jgi:hypothetical protein